MRPLVVNGWLKVPCEAPDLAVVELATGRTRPGEWRPAFRDWHDGVRVAQVRTTLPAGSWTAWVKVDGRVVNRFSVRA